jgi:hypothetical protein
MDMPAVHRLANAKQHRNRPDIMDCVTIGKLARCRFVVEAARLFFDSNETIVDIESLSAQDQNRKIGLTCSKKSFPIRS